MRKALLAALLLAPSLAWAQNTVIIQGAFTVNDCIKVIARTIFKSTGAPCATAVFGANPTASVGPTAVNGSATTYLRSDGAPPLNLTANWAFVPSSSLTGFTIDGTTFNVDSTNHRIGIGTAAPISTLDVKATTDEHVLFRGHGGLSTGSRISSVNDANNSYKPLEIDASFVNVTQGPLTVGYASVSAAANLWVKQSVQISDASALNSVFITHGGAAATLQLGAANAASPVAQTLQCQGSRSGTDTNVGGANCTIASGQGTGTGTISSIILQTPIAVASGTGAQTMTTGLTIKGGQAVLSGYTVANLPAGITGGHAYVTDAVACTFLTAVAGGGTAVCPVFYNGTAWVGG